MVQASPKLHSGPPVGAALELQQRYARGDADAFDDLARPHLDAMYTLCLRVVGNEQEAEDLAQDALARALVHHGRFNPDRSFRPWLFRITMNACRDRLRTVWWTRVLPLSRTVEGRAPSPERLTQAAQRDLMVRRALLGMPLKYREAISLFHLEDMSYSEMNEITGVSVAALKQRVRRGLALLERRLQTMYPELFADRRSSERGD